MEELISLRLTRCRRHVHVPLDVLDEDGLQIIKTVLVELGIHDAKILVRRRYVRPHLRRQQERAQRHRSPIARKEGNVRHRDQAVHVNQRHQRALRRNLPVSKEEERNLTALENTGEEGENVVRRGNEVPLLDGLRVRKTAGGDDEAVGWNGARSVSQRDVQSTSHADEVQGHTNDCAS